MVEIVVERTTSTTPDIVLNVHARILQQRLDVNLPKSGLNAQENSRILFSSMIFIINLNLNSAFHSSEMR